MKEQQVKLSKLYKGGKWIGYGLSVDGQLLSGQMDLSITTTPLGQNNSVVVTLAWQPSLITEAPDIHLDWFLSETITIGEGRVKSLKTFAQSTDA
nr:MULTISPECIES: hypothetical protein [Providencia]